MSETLLTAVAICAVAALLASPVACTMHRQAKVGEAIKAGADPIEARCAMSADPFDPMCLVRARTTRETMPQRPASSTGQPAPDEERANCAPDQVGNQGQRAEGHRGRHPRAHESARAE